MWAHTSKLKVRLVCVKLTSKNTSKTHLCAVKKVRRKVHVQAKVTRGVHVQVKVKLQNYNKVKAEERINLIFAYILIHTYAKFIKADIY